VIDSPCECQREIDHRQTEHTNPDSLDARLFPSVVLAVAPAVAMVRVRVNPRVRVEVGLGVGMRVGVG